MRSIRIIKIKDTFSKLFSNKVPEIYNIMTNSNQKDKHKLNIITKDLLRKQIMVSMSMNNIEKVMAQSNIYCKHQ